VRTKKDFMKVFVMIFSFFLAFFYLGTSEIQAQTLLYEKIVWKPAQYVDPRKESKRIPFKITGPGILQIRTSLQPYYCVTHAMKYESVFGIPGLWEFGWKQITQRYLYDGKPAEHYKVGLMCYLESKIKRATFLDEFEIPAKQYKGEFVITSPMKCSFNECHRRGAILWAVAEFIPGSNIKPSGSDKVGQASETTKPKTAHFDKPTYKGYRLDICRVWGAECGKEAADAFCRTKGYNRADSWEIDHDIGHISPTIIISSGQICNQNFCDGFKFIKCTD
jgi:hypothetical protein